MSTTEIISSFTGHYWWLSNFAAVPILMDGVVYTSVEHAFQAAKTTDADAREAIRAASTPSEAKRMGRNVKLRAGWNKKRLKVMEELLREKFAAPDYKALLLETGDALLVEGNWWGDQFWGVCDGEGENHLGKLLMKIRKELRAEAG